MTRLAIAGVLVASLLSACAAQLRDSEPLEANTPTLADVDVRLILLVEDTAAKDIGRNDWPELTDLLSQAHGVRRVGDGSDHAWLEQAARAGILGDLRTLLGDARLLPPAAGAVWTVSAPAPHMRQCELLCRALLARADADDVGGWDDLELAAQLASALDRTPNGAAAIQAQRLRARMREMVRARLEADNSDGAPRQAEHAAAMLAPKQTRYHLELERLLATAAVIAVHAAGEVDPEDPDYDNAWAQVAAWQRDLSEQLADLNAAYDASMDLVLPSDGSGDAEARLAHIREQAESRGDADIALRRSLPRVAALVTPRRIDRADQAMLVAEIALRLHAAEHGEFPARPEDLSPETLDAWPIDPMAPPGSGAKLGYMRSPEGWAELWSRELDSTDQRGQSRRLRLR